MKYIKKEVLLNYLHRNDIHYLSEDDLKNILKRCGDDFFIIDGELKITHEYKGKFSK